MRAGDVLREVAVGPLGPTHPVQTLRHRDVAGRHALSALGTADGFVGGISHTRSIEPHLPGGGKALSPTVVIGVPYGLMVIVIIVQ